MDWISGAFLASAASPSRASAASTRATSCTSRTSTCAGDWHGPDGRCATSRGLGRAPLRGSPRRATPTRCSLAHHRSTWRFAKRLAEGIEAALLPVIGVGSAAPPHAASAESSPCGGAVVGRRRLSSACHDKGKLQPFCRARRRERWRACLPVPQADGLVRDHARDLPRRDLAHRLQPPRAPAPDDGGRCRPDGDGPLARRLRYGSLRDDRAAARRRARTRRPRAFAPSATA